MSKHVYCEKCLDVIEGYEDLVILNGKPYHYHCYEEELKEEKKKSLIERFITWRFVNNGLIGNIQALIAIIVGIIIYIYGGRFADQALCRLTAGFIIAFTISIRMYGFFIYEIKAKRRNIKSKVLQNKEAVLQIVKFEATDMLKIAGTIAAIVLIWNIISAALM